MGVLLSILARLGAVAVSVPIVLLLRDEIREMPRQTPALDHNPANVITLVVILVVGAPIIEELFFRGLVQRALETVLPAAPAIGIQAALFAAVHALPGAGVANLVIVAQVMVGGVAFGFAARKWRRLGPGIAGHAVFNVLPVLGLVFAAS